MVSLRKRD